MRESQVVLEWQREAEIERSHKLILRLLELRHRQAVPTDLTATVTGSNDLEELSRWFDLAVMAESLEAFRNALDATTSSGNGAGGERPA